MAETFVQERQLNIEWADYTPTWAASGTAPAIGNGTLDGEYCVIGNICFFTIHWSAGSTTTFGTGTYTFSLPFTAGSSQEPVSGQLWYIDSGVKYDLNVALRIQQGESTVQGWQTGTANGWGQTVPITWANGDQMIVTMFYRV